MLHSKLAPLLTPAVAWLLAISSAASANVVLSGTRLVYPATDQEISVYARNPGASPVLAQAWIDSGDATQRAEASEAPFLIVPPMTRIEAQGGQVFRVMHIPGHQPLPQDRESVFYFNVLDVPPKPQAEANSSYMQFAYRTRVKLFYRPQSLPGSATTAPSKLVWSLHDNQGQVELEIHNPSAFHVSFNDVQVQVADSRYPVDSDMVGPYSTSRHIVTGLFSLPPTATVRFNWINDFGSANPEKALIH